MMVPERYGGSAAGAVSYSLALQEIAYSCASVAVTLSVTNLSTEPIMNFGTDDQKKKFLRPLASGEHVGAFALTEPGAGSDPSSLKTTAIKKGKAYIINGAKQFITNGSYAGPFHTYRQDFAGQKRALGISGSRRDKGLQDRQGREQDGALAHPTPWRSFFEDCEVPAENLLGKSGHGPVKSPLMPLTAAGSASRPRQSA